MATKAHMITNENTEVRVKRNHSPTMPCVLKSLFREGRALLKPVGMNYKQN